MIQELTIETAVAILNEAKWRGYDRWSVTSFCGKMGTAVRLLAIKPEGLIARAVREFIPEIDAIAIAHGIVAEKRAADLERANIHLGRAMERALDWIRSTQSIGMSPSMEEARTSTVLQIERALEAIK